MQIIEFNIVYASSFKKKKKLSVVNGPYLQTVSEPDANAVFLTTYGFNTVRHALFEHNKYK